jgi:NAD(P)-dependent dehydrogenase (short-subunit alcohol dehydrogenase family)
MSDSGLQGRTFVVTGANTGIGKETARVLAQRGARLVFACRSREKTLPVMDEIRAETRNDELAFVPLDLGDLASVRAAAQSLLDSEPEIHVLINNAGLAGARGLTKDGFELTFGVNHLGPFLFTQLLLPRLVASRPARIVNVASGAHYRAQRIDFDALRAPTRSVSGFPEYGVSKLCNVLHAAELARRLGDEGVTSYSLHPGTVASDVWRRVPWPVSSLMKLFMLSVEEGAKTSLHCATDPSLARETGRYYDRCSERKPARLARDGALARRVWEVSEDWTSN